MKKKLLFGITSLTLGGAERVLVDLVNRLCDKYDITIFTIYSKGELEKQLSKKVKLKSLYNVSYSELSNIQKHLIMPLKVLVSKNKIYDKYIKENYDIEIAFLEGPITRIFSVKNNAVKKIAWIHNDISLVFGNGIKAKIKKNIDKKIYSKYESLVFVSKDNLNKFNEIYTSLDKVNKEVVYNYIDKANVIKKAEQEEVKLNNDKINFVTVARLVEQKGIDRLIEVHNKLIEEELLHDFYVIGDGPERQKLEEMIRKYEISNTFHLLGKKENPYPYIKESDCFALLSNYEGYPMVLLEARILGKDIIITNTAAREVVEKYRKAQIVENTEQGIYEGLKKVISNNKKANEKNIEEIEEIEEYDNDYIIEKIEKLFI